MVHPQHHHLVNGLLGGHPLHQGVDGLVDHRHKHPVGDKAGEVVHLDRHLAQFAGQFNGDLGGLVGGGQATDDLHQHHKRHRVHKVHADDLLRALGGRGQHGDGDRRGVGSQDDLRPAYPVQFGEDALFQFHILAHGLDHKIGLGNGGQVPGGMQPGHRRILLLGGHLALFHAFRQELFDGGHGALELLRDDLHHDRLVAALGKDLSDAPSHRSGTDHGNGLDVHRFLLLFQNGNP